MDDYLAKPFSLSALRATIDRWTTFVREAGDTTGARRG